MSETKFTPGPWNVPPGDVMIRARGCSVAEVIPQPAARANARLIAAAPELYAALKAYVDDDGRLSERERKNLAREAIAKAEGKATT